MSNTKFNPILDLQIKLWFSDTSISDKRTLIASQQTTFSFKPQKNIQYNWTLIIIPTPQKNSYKINVESKNAREKKM